MELYNMWDFFTPDEFFAMKTAWMGKYKKNEVLDAPAAVCSIIEDWNSGKIKLVLLYYSRIFA